MEFTDLFKNYSKSIISSQILKSPYEEIYNNIFNSENNYENILIINQGVYVPLYNFFDIIIKKDYHITYLDENELSINKLNQDLIYFKNRNENINNVDNEYLINKSRIDTYFEIIQSNIYNFKNYRNKNLKYDLILIHHINNYLDNNLFLTQTINEISHKNSVILFFASINNEDKNSYKNKIRTNLANYTNMKIGKLYSLEELILLIPQNIYTLNNIIPYRESYYLGYGKNIIYKFILNKK
jgi:hypothetical protein